MKPTYQDLENQITELKKQNQILKLSKNSDNISEARYRKMIGNIGDVIVIIDGKGLNKYKSPNIEKYFGWKPEDLIGKSTFENVHKEDEEFAQKFIGNLISEPNVVNTIELRYRCKDGSYKWIEFTCCNLLNDPNINGLLGNYHDITDRKRVEQSLQESESLYKSLFKNLNSPLSLYEVLLSENGEPYDYRFLAVNSAYENTVGLKASDLIGKTLLGVFPGTETSWLETIKEVCITGKTTTVENYAKEVDLYVELTVYIPQKGQMAFICPNITDRKKAELKLIENQIFQNTILNTSPDIIYVYDVQEKKNVYSNDGIMNILGYSVKEIQQMGDKIISNLMHPDDFKIYINTIIPKYQSADDNEFIKHKYRMKHKKGYWRLLHSKELIFTRDEKNQPKQIFGIITDITDRNKAEQELIKAKEKAEESDRLKSAFLANMSHEIRTPMNAILGFSDLLKKENLAEEKKEKYLELINSGGKRLLTIISDIIDVSKIDANQIKINISICNINLLIDNLYEQFSVSSKSTDVMLKTIKGLNKFECNVRTDGNRLVQILSNLIENALKFTKKGIVEFGYTSSNNLLRFFVKDSGHGIAPSDHKLIFERFSQANQVHTFASGTGLGLSIVKGIVDLLGGEIWVESEINKGATFYFTIPYNTAEQKETKHTDTSIINYNTGITVLIAEDDTSNFLYIEELFSEYNYTIIHAWDGVEAVELFNKHTNIELVLMDIKMPVMNGLEATKEIRKTNKEIPIIAQTAYAMADDKEKAIKSGCNDYISKPVSQDKLFEIINKYKK
jgi:PAS domain S-box-containing protein